MTAELVGPLRRIRFADGTVRGYDVPRNTLDIRYDACGNHHLACDCREALLAENEGEYRGIIDDLHDAIVAATAGHPVWDITRPWGPQDRACQCPMCKLRRDKRIRFFEWRDEQYRATWGNAPATGLGLDEVPF